MPVKRNCLECSGITGNDRFCCRSCSAKYRHKNNINIGWPKNGTNENNTNWKGEKAKYGAVHAWVVRHWGKASSCDGCLTSSAKVYDWSNRDGKYSRQKTDWQQLCRSCHQKYDYSVGLR